MTSRPSTADQIRTEALRLFAARGYAAVSMREIGEAVGIRAGGLYNHFATKQDILLDVMRRHMEELLAAWDETDPAGAGPAERLTAFARFHIRFHFEKPDAVFIAYMELRNLEPQNFSAIERLRARYEGALRSIIMAGGATFAVPDPAVAARALIAMLTGITTWYRPEGRLSIGEIEDIYVNMARRSMGLPTLGRAREEGGTACSTAA